jgi:hypothetical protein
VIAKDHFGATPNEDRGRAVRQTFEAMAYQGLVYRSKQGNLVTTRLGHYLLSFLGLLKGEKGWANTNNIRIASGPSILGLSVLVEVRVVWSLMRGLGNRLSNEELNRAMLRIGHIGDIPDTIKAIQDARAKDDPTIIGPRLYDDASYGGEDETGQRKAINPFFLLAGGGGLFIDISSRDAHRVLNPDCVDLIDRALEREFEPLHASTAADTIAAISQASQAPRSYVRELYG